MIAEVSLPIICIVKNKFAAPHFIPRQCSGEYPRLSTGGWGSIPRREEEVVAIVLLFD